MKSCIRWVVALKPEAVPVIEKFGLRHSRESPDMFPVYRSAGGDVELVISGPGKVAAAAATAFLAARGEPDTIAGWINFGIAGSGSDDYGTVYLAGKIRDVTTGQSWYPPAIVDRKTEPPRSGIDTVSQPSDQYPDDGTLLEMEAAGFFPIALRASSVELCQVIKIVSDDANHSIADVIKTQVTELCSAALQQIEPWLNAFRSLVGEQAERNADPPGYGEWIEKMRFTETQRHRLRRLLRHWHNLNGGFDVSPQFTAVEVTGAQKMLDAFETKLKGLASVGFQG